MNKVVFDENDINKLANTLTRLLTAEGADKNELSEEVIWLLDKILDITASVRIIQTEKHITEVWLDIPVEGYDLVLSSLIYKGSQDSKITPNNIRRAVSRAIAVLC